jgi:hypothetical protein
MMIVLDIDIEPVIEALIDTDDIFAYVCGLDPATRQALQQDALSHVVYEMQCDTLEGKEGRFYVELLETLREAESIQKKWRQPIPPKTIGDFCRANGMSRTTTFVELLAKADPNDKNLKGDAVTRMQKRIDRYCDIKDHIKPKPPLPSERAFAEFLKQVMSAKDPKRYGSIDIRDIMWIPFRPDEPDALGEG